MITGSLAVAGLTGRRGGTARRRAHRQWAVPRPAAALGHARRRRCWRQYHGAGRTDDQPGAGGRAAADGGGEHPRLAVHETPAASVPASLPALDEGGQHARRPAPADAQSAARCRCLSRRATSRTARLAPSRGDPARRRRGGSAGTLADQERGNERKRMEFRPRASSNTVRCRSCSGARRQQVEERLLFRLAQRGKAIQRRERAPPRGAHSLGCDRCNGGRTQHGARAAMG